MSAAWVLVLASVAAHSRAVHAKALWSLARIAVGMGFSPFQDCDWCHLGSLARPGPHRSPPPPSIMNAPAIFELALRPGERLVRRNGGVGDGPLPAHARHAAVRRRLWRWLLVRGYGRSAWRRRPPSRLARSGARPRRRGCHYWRPRCCR